MTDAERLQLAADTIASADALLIGAGAGMGVDSGLPDFRGTEGFWKAYPPYAKLGLGFVELANPLWFHSDPTLAWGFYGHRYNLYRSTTPHEGFHILRRWSEKMRLGSFIYTSNVDGAFQAAGFSPNRILEVHGSVHWMQCIEHCGLGLFPSETPAPNGVPIDEDTLRALEPLPQCPHCKAMARPNILMFGDGEWDERCRPRAGRSRLGPYRKLLPGGAAQSSSSAARRHGHSHGSPFLRTGWRSASMPRSSGLNVRRAAGARRQVGLAMGALAGLRSIDALLSGEHP